MANAIDIMNAALYHLGAGNLISSISENSPEAQACRLFYWKCVRECMQAFPYAFGTKFGALEPLITPVQNAYGKVGEFATPEWQYAYGYPPDCLHIHRLFSSPNPLEPAAVLFDGSWDPGWPWGFDSSQSRIPFKIAMNPHQPGTLWILCQWSSLWAEYSANKVPENLFPPNFEAALGYLLAAKIAPSITRGDQNRLGENAMLLYKDCITESKINSVNEQQDPPLPDSELIRARNGYSTNALGGPLPWASFPNGFIV